MEAGRKERGGREEAEKRVGEARGGYKKVENKVGEEGKGEKR